MRKREQIERQLSRADDIDSFNGGGDTVSQELILEVLLDIRDLLLPKEATLNIYPVKPHRFIDMDVE